MTNKDLFKEAIADAKQVREAALANAKVALEEALTPKLQSMLSAKLQEMETYSDDSEEDYYDLDSINFDDLENLKSNDAAQSQAFADMELDGDEEDFDLSEILAELEDEEKQEMKEAKNKEEEEEEEEEEEKEEKEEEEEVEVKDLTVDQLKDMIKDIISQELETEEYETETDEESEINLDGDEEMGDEEDEMMGEINLEELLAELDALEDIEEAKKDDEELKEAINTINTLRTELQEVNLLNAKLLYVNKIFKAKNLTESQKVKVIASFDKATTTKEAKIVFESLESTLTAVTTNVKSQIKESFGFASKAAGVAPKKQIVEVNESITRMQQLAGIK
jgi:hypothetical protein